ncbi:hypothetical protein WDU94_011500 [Cyamophila willieti]
MYSTKCTSYQAHQTHSLPHKYSTYTCHAIPQTEIETYKSTPIEYEFMMFKPSLIASGCILAAYNGLLSASNSRPSSNQLAELTGLTQHATSDVTDVSLLVEKIIQRETETNSTSNQSTSNSNKSSQQHSSKHNTTSNNNNSHTKEKPDTPIDVQDVRF